MKQSSTACGFLVISVTITQSEKAWEKKNQRDGGIIASDWVIDSIGLLAVLVSPYFVSFD